MTITLDHLSKRYGSFDAVRDLTLHVERGSITAFLGQNGAGKTTTIKMLLGMTKPTRGRAYVFGFDIADPAQSLDIRRRVGYVSEDKRLYDYMTVGEIIRFTKAFYPTWRDDIERNLMDNFRLPLEKAIRKLSKGMRTQTALLLALARGAELLILDEPTEGLDPLIAEKVLEQIVGTVADGATVLFTSHQIAEVEEVADHVLLIDGGRLVLDTSMDALGSDFRRIRAVSDTPVPIEALALDGVRRFSQEGRALTVTASHNVDELVERIRDYVPAASLEVLPVTLKDVVLESLER